MASLIAKDDRLPSCVYENSLPRGCQAIELSHISTKDSLQREDDVADYDEEHYDTVCVNPSVNKPLPQPFDRKGDSTKQEPMLTYDSLQRGEDVEDDDEEQYDAVCVDKYVKHPLPQHFDRKGDSSTKQETKLRSEVARPGRMTIVVAVVVVVLVLAVIGLTISGVVMYRTLNAKIGEFDIIQDTNRRMGSLNNFVHELNNRSDTSMEYVQLEIKDLKAEFSRFQDGWSNQMVSLRANDSEAFDIINGTNRRLDTLDNLVQELKKHSESSLADMNCTFDVNMCGWRQSDTDDFDWTRIKGTTSSSGTGPNSDHTSGNGYYYYTEASDPRNPGDSAVLISPTLSSDQDLCLQLYTNMYGNNMGQIDIRSKSCGGTTMLARYTTADSSAIWRERNIDIPAQTAPFTVQITGTRGSEYRSDAAIDDVTIKRGKC